MTKFSTMSITKSSKPNKKYQAVFLRDNGRTKTTHFGQKNADDYTKTKDKEQRKRYRTRHKKDLLTKDPTRAGHLAFHILWGDSTSIRENIKSYKKRFNFN